MAAGQNYTNGGLNTDIMAEMWQGAFRSRKICGEGVQTHGRATEAEIVFHQAV